MILKKLYQKEISRMNLKKRIIKNYVNFRGRSLKGRKIVLIESDDWGSIRMPSRVVYDKLVSNGIDIDKCVFDKYDALESEKDLTELFEVLTSVRDSKGKHAIMAPYVVLANPDFERIEECRMERYVYESVLSTYKKNPHTENSFAIIKEGMIQGIWNPQFHGREHVNVNRWLKACRRNDKFVSLAFHANAFLSTAFPKDLDCFPAFDYDTETEIVKIEQIISEGLDMFRKIYDNIPISICAPCGIANQKVFKVALEKGIRMIPGQILRPNGIGEYEKLDYFWGDRYFQDAMHYRRNCKFDPSNPRYKDSVDSCLAEIEIAFRWGKPAVIDSHRVNYIGSIFPENRETSLRQLKRLLKEIVKRWPDVEFMTSEEIYNLYR